GGTLRGKEIIYGEIKWSYPSSAQSKASTIERIMIWTTDHQQKKKSTLSISSSKCDKEEAANKKRALILLNVSRSETSINAMDQMNNRGKAPM
ncbi:15052_t:CDS:2, partial [Entrophospora sp. SA101]